jgi:hypothetical protein
MTDKGFLVPGAGLEPARLAMSHRIFVPSTAFAAPPKADLWSGLSLQRIIWLLRYFIIGSFVGLDKMKKYKMTKLQMT